MFLIFVCKKNWKQVDNISSYASSKIITINNQYAIAACKCNSESAILILARIYPSHMDQTKRIGISYCSATMTDYSPIFYPQIIGDILACMYVFCIVGRQLIEKQQILAHDHGQSVCFMEFILH